MTDQFTEAQLERRIGDYIAAIAGFITNGEATAAIMADVRRYLAAATCGERADGAMLDAYDAGLLNDFGGGDVEWWQDYIRAELGRAHDFYASQTAAAPKAPMAEGWQAIESAPDKGPFLAYRPRVKGPCVVERNPQPFIRNMVTCVETGKSWNADWWMPNFPIPPGKG